LQRQISRRKHGRIPLRSSHVNNCQILACHVTAEMGAVLARVVGAFVYPRTSSVRRDHESRSRSVRVARPLGVAARRGRRAGPWQQRQCLQGDGCDCWAERSRASGPGEEVPGGSGPAATAASSSAAASGATASTTAAASGATAATAAAASGATAATTAAASGATAATAAAASGATAAAAAAASGSGATATAAASGSGAAATAAASGSGAAASAAASSAFKPAVWAASGAGRGVRGSRWRRETGCLLE